MVKYIEALTEYIGSEPSLFLAGGITGCPGWQSELVQQLAHLPLINLNPRRQNFPSDDPTAAPAQIAWEHRHLRKASAILFWFPCETLCPITLYELGAWSMTHKPLFVGTDPGYARRQDVLIQTQLVRPDLTVVDSLEALSQQVEKWCVHEGEKIRCK